VAGGAGGGHSGGEEEEAGSGGGGGGGGGGGDLLWGAGVVPDGYMSSSEGGLDPEDEVGGGAQHVAMAAACAG
jgi:hypothetical protein